MRFFEQEIDTMRGALEELTEGSTDGSDGADILVRIQGNIERMIEVTDRMGANLQRQQREIEHLCQQKKEILEKLNRLK